MEDKKALSHTKEAVEARFNVTLGFGVYNSVHGIFYSCIARQKGKVVARTLVEFATQREAAFAVGEFLGKKEMEHG